MSSSAAISMGDAVGVAVPAGVGAAAGAVALGPFSEGIGGISVVGARAGLKSAPTCQNLIVVNFL